MESDTRGRLEEREQRQNAEQQHGDTFTVDSEEATDTSGIPAKDDEEANEDEELRAQGVTGLLTGRSAWRRTAQR
jgi:hypothetical protein